MTKHVKIGIGGFSRLRVACQTNEEVHSIEVRSAVMGRNVRYNVYGLRPYTLIEQTRLMEQRLTIDIGTMEYDDVLRIFDAAWS